MLKRAREFGQAEVWMNERVSRADPTCCARLVDSFEIQPDPERKKHPCALRLYLWHNSFILFYIFFMQLCCLQARSLAPVCISLL